MLAKLDESVGKTIQALADKGILNNTIVLFAADNGAPTSGVNSNSGSNEPLRGQKNTPFEGGIHTAAAIWSPLLKQRNYVSQQVVHSVDWLPTFGSLAGVKFPADLKLDGQNVWPILSENLPVQPRKILHCLDEVTGYSADLNGDWKYINGTSLGRFDQWGKPLLKTEIDPVAANYEAEVLAAQVQTIVSKMQTKLSKTQVTKLRVQARIKYATSSTVVEKYECLPKQAPCLFNVKTDPCEQFNLAATEAEKVYQLAKEVDGFLQSAVPPAKIEYSDARSDPSKFNGVWNWWAPTVRSDGASGNNMKECMLLITSSILIQKFFSNL